MGISGVNMKAIASALSTDTSSDSKLIDTLLKSSDRQPTLFDVLTDNSSSSSSSYDILDLSSEGQSAADSLGELLEKASLTGVQNSVNTLSAAFRKKITSALAAAGIDTSQEIDLQVDADGNVLVSNDNPQTQQIEAAINNDSELKAAVEQYVDFMKSMVPTLTGTNGSGTNSGSMVEQLLTLLADSTPATVTLSLEGDRLETTYRDSSSNAYVLASC